MYAVIISYSLQNLRTEWFDKSKSIDTFASVMKSKMNNRQFEKICKALSDPYRIKLLDVIRKEPEWTQCTDLLYMSDLAQSTVSHHLKQLVDADLLHSEKDGRFIMYKINKETFAACTDWLNRFK